MSVEVDREWTYQVREQLRAGAFAILAFGLVLTLVSVFADPLAVGMPGSGFGWKQISGTVIGLGISSLGLWLIMRFNDEDERS
ncbi:MAG: hypothetical protein R3A46_08450 [Thermomicrobiales bacterium]